MSARGERAAREAQAGRDQADADHAAGRRPVAYEMSRHTAAWRKAYRIRHAELLETAQAAPAAAGRLNPVLTVNRRQVTGAALAPGNVLYVLRLDTADLADLAGLVVEGLEVCEDGALLLRLRPAAKGELDARQAEALADPDPFVPVTPDGDPQ